MSFIAKQRLLIRYDSSDKLLMKELSYSARSSSVYNYILQSNVLDQSPSMTIII